MILGGKRECEGGAECVYPVEYVVGLTAFRVPTCRRHLGGVVARKLDAGQVEDTTVVRVA